MPKRIVIIQGHPDTQTRHYGHALADEYAKGAEDSGYEVRRVEVAQLDFPFLRRKEDFEKTELPVALAPAVEAIKWANHLVILYPLWLGSMPALLKAFLEQVFRPGVAFEYQRREGCRESSSPRSLLASLSRWACRRSPTVGFFSPTVSRAYSATSSDFAASDRSRALLSETSKG